MTANAPIKKLMFLCDRKRPCCSHTYGCGITCFHTADVNHAKNKGFDAKNFKKDNNIKDVWWEVEE